MTVLSADQVYYLARQVGLSRSSSITATAVAYPESSLDTMAHNTTGGVDSYGLWQIEMSGLLGPARRAQFRLKSNDELYDTQVNALAMETISAHGLDWIPWTVYRTGAYKLYLGLATAAANRVDHMTAEQQTALGVGAIGATTIRKSPLGGLTTGPLSGAEKAVNSVGDFINALGEFIRFVGTRENWTRRLLPAVLGAILILVFVNHLLDATALGQAAKAGAKATAKAAVVAA